MRNPSLRDCADAPLELPDLSSSGVAIKPGPDRPIGSPRNEHGIAKLGKAADAPPMPGKDRFKLGTNAIEGCLKLNLQLLHGDNRSTASSFEKNSRSRSSVSARDLGQTGTFFESRKCGSSQIFGHGAPKARSTTRS
jgi:hypothetical protein